MEAKHANCIPESAWAAWQKVGREWVKETWATSAGAVHLAAVAFASGAASENERNAKKRAFAEGARNAIAKATGTE